MLSRDGNRSGIRAKVDHLLPFPSQCAWGDMKQDAHEDKADECQRKDSRLEVVSRRINGLRSNGKSQMHAA